MKRIKPPKSLVARAVDEISKYITDCRMKPGETLPSTSELSRQSGCGISSIREALRILETFGMVKLIQGVGVKVDTFKLDRLFDHLPYGLLVDKEHLMEFLEIREVLELHFIPVIVRKITKSHLKELEQIVERMKQEAKTEGRITTEDRKFHLALVEPIQNQTLAFFIDLYWKLLIQIRESEGYRETPSPPSMAVLHEKILQAIKEKDAEKYRKLLKDHFLDIKERLSYVKD